MYPLTVITGILFASSFMIAFGLAVVSFLFLVVGLDDPRLGDEFPGVVSSMGLFTVVTAVCAISFLGQLKRRAWRWYAQLAMWGAIALVVVYYLPD